MPMESSHRQENNVIKGNDPVDTSNTAQLEPQQHHQQHHQQPEQKSPNMEIEEKKGEPATVPPSPSPAVQMITKDTANLTVETKKNESSDENKLVDAKAVNKDSGGVTEKGKQRKEDNNVDNSNSSTTDTFSSATTSSLTASSSSSSEKKKKNSNKSSNSNASNGKKDRKKSLVQVQTSKREGQTVVESVSLHPSMWIPREEHDGLEKVTFGPSNFEKLRLLGKGDVGKVYLAKLRGTDQLYAIKALKKEDMIRRNKIKRVLTEREILVTTDHPFIVSLYATFQSAEKLYYVMEYCAGGEMYRLLQKQKNKLLPEHMVKFYAAEVLLALEYMHVMGYIYRDLKPENILIHESGHIRLSDFDLSKSCSNAPLNPKVVQSMFASMKSSKIDTKQVQQFNSFVGTEEYIAPEVITGFGHSSAVDWWTFGIFIYELLYGVTPFKGVSQKETFSNILNKKLKFYDNKNMVSKQGKDLIKRLLVSDQKKRLGHKNGSSDIKSHPWFKGINWALIRNEKPPIVPELRDKYDTSHFRNIYDSDNEEDVPLNEKEETSLANPFREFRYVSAHRDAYGSDRTDEDAVSVESGSRPTTPNIR